MHGLGDQLHVAKQKFVTLPDHLILIFPPSWVGAVLRIDPPRSSSVGGDPRMSSDDWPRTRQLSPRA
jgi:hypothetical protein